MTARETRGLAIAALVVAVIACIGTFLALPQVQSMVSSLFAVPIQAPLASSTERLRVTELQDIFNNTRACPQLSRMIEATRWIAARKLRAVLS